MFSESQTVEPHVIIHAAVSQITVEKIKKEQKKRKSDSFCAPDSKGTSQKKYCLFKIHVQKHSAKHGEVLKLLGLLHFNNRLFPELSENKNFR